MTRAKNIVALGALSAVLYIALAYGLYSNVTRRVLGANDFYSRWEGARALFLRGENPYSDAVTHEIQIGMSGRLARPDEDQVAFAYPLYAAFVAVPFVALTYAEAQALWMAFLVLATVGASIALTRCFHITSPVPFAVLVLLALLFYPTVRAIFNGQYAVVSFFCIALAILCIQSQWDIAAGMFIALATVKPQTAVFLAPAMILWSARQRRWKIVVAAAGVFIALVLASLFFVPTWPIDFVRGLVQYTEYEPVGPPTQILVEAFVTDRIWRTVLLAVALVALVAWMFWRVVRTLKASWENCYSTLDLAAIVTTLCAGRIGSSDQVLLLVPWFHWLSDWITCRRYMQAALAASVILILPWLVFLATVRGNAENISVELTLPIISLVVYMWIRHNSSPHSVSLPQGERGQVSSPSKGEG